MKLAIFERMRAAGGFANEDPADVMEAEKTLREFAAMEKESVCAAMGTPFRRAGPRAVR
jgi:hypothetical protein